MDGSLLRHHIAAFRLIPYVQRQDLDAWAEEETEPEAANPGLPENSTSEDNSDTRSESDRTDSTYTPSP